jgi:hypothetical protein
MRAKAMDEDKVLDYIAGLVADDLLLLIEEKYNPQYARQPRDHHGRWTSGALARLVGPTLGDMPSHDPRRGSEPVLNPKEEPKKPKKPAAGGAGGGGEGGAVMAGAGAGVHRPVDELANPKLGLRNTDWRRMDKATIAYRNAKQEHDAISLALPGMKLHQHEKLVMEPIDERSQRETQSHWGFSAAGLYYGGMSGKRIGLNVDIHHQDGTATHEMGHWIDNVVGQRRRIKQRQEADAAGGAKPTQYPTGFEHREHASDHIDRQNPFYGVFKAIDDTPSFKKLQRTEAADLASGKSKRPYYGTPREAFARAFTQYIAVQSPRGSGIRKDIAIRQSTHWHDSEFGPVKEAFDKAFEGLGWK